MNIEELRAYCLAKNHVTEEFPFDEYALTFKVAGKVFAITNIESDPPSVNLKCAPEKAIELREEFNGVILPGYHMNKKHWNTVHYSSLDAKFVQELIDHSFDRVIKGMSKKKQKELGFLLS